MRKKLKIKIPGARTRARELFLPGKYQRIHNEAEEELPKTLTKIISPDFLAVYYTFFTNPFFHIATLIFRMPRTPLRCVLFINRTYET